MKRESVIPALAGFLAGAVCAAGYAVVLRPRHLRWGATEAERLQPMPGDEVVRRPDYVATRALTIEASREEVWPWLMELAERRDFEVHSMEAERWIVLVPPGRPESASWSLVPYPQGPERTRLVLTDPAGAVAVRAWMRRVKRRAEALAAARRARGTGARREEAAPEAPVRLA